MSIVDRDDIDLLVAAPSEVNLAHHDAVFASADLFGHIVTDGLWTDALIYALLGTER